MNKQTKVNLVRNASAFIGGCWIGVISDYATRNAPIGVRLATWLMGIVAGGALGCQMADTWGTIAELVIRDKSSDMEEEIGS